MTYEPVYLDFGKNEQKAPEYTKYNPNGRIPTLIDHHNGDFILWESDAILLYLTDKYDTEKRLTVTDEKEKYSLIQWLFFQSSGQGLVSCYVSNGIASPPSAHILAHTSVRRRGSCVTTPNKFRARLSVTVRRPSA